MAEKPIRDALIQAMDAYLRQDETAGDTDNNVYRRGQAAMSQALSTPPPAGAQQAAAEDVQRAGLIAHEAQQFAGDRTHIGKQVYVNDLVWALGVLAAPAAAQNEPSPGSSEASAMIDSVLAEYGWPTNPKNAARAGFVAAQRLAATPAPEAAPSDAIDARRYRWLRAKIDAHDGDLTVAKLGAFGLEPWSGDNLDAAIDGTLPGPKGDISTSEEADWQIDHSAGRPILTYKKCSVIEAEDAEYVMRLIAADRVALKGLTPAGGDR